MEGRNLLFYPLDYIGTMAGAVGFEPTHGFNRLIVFKTILFNQT